MTAAPRTYSPGGKGHRMLERLAQGPAADAELRRAAVPKGDRRLLARMHHVILALTADGLAVRAEPGAYVLTLPGADALACLRVGHAATFGHPAGAGPR
jgi:hypothetical protein